MDAIRVVATATLFQTVRRSVRTLTMEPGPAISTSCYCVSEKDKGWRSLVAGVKSRGGHQGYEAPSDGEKGAWGRTFSCQLSNTLIA